MFKTSFKAALLASAFAGLAATAALADEAVVTPAPVAPAAEPASPFTFNGSVGYTNNYVFRGQTQTKRDGAIFGSFGVTHESGLYAGIWASSIKEFSVAAPGNPSGGDENLELDFYAGFANSINAFSYDVGAVYYMYPGANDAGAEDNYYEIYAKTGYDFGFFSINDGVYFSPNYAGETDETVYGYGGANVPLPFLPFGTYLTGNIGYLAYLNHPTADSYFDYAGGIGAKVEGFDMTLKYVGTLGVNGSKEGLGNQQIFNSKDSVVFTISRSF